MADHDEWQQEMQRYLAHFNRAGKRPTALFSQQAQLAPVWVPAMDMYETDEALVILLDLAGVDASRTEVQAQPNLLVVRGVRHERHGSEEAHRRNYHTLEIPYGRFERSVRLPPGLDTGEARANYEDGLLEITLPKRLPRQVPISVQVQAQTT